MEGQAVGRSSEGDTASEAAAAPPCMLVGGRNGSSSPSMLPGREAATGAHPCWRRMLPDALAVCMRRGQPRSPIPAICLPFSGLCPHSILPALRSSLLQWQRQCGFAGSRECSLAQHAERGRDCLYGSTSDGGSDRSELAGRWMGRQRQSAEGIDWLF